MRSNSKGAGLLTRATAETMVNIGGEARRCASPARSPAWPTRRPTLGRAHARRPDRSSTETGNGGYTSVHTDVHLVYDAPTNLFLPGNHVDQTITTTQCLTDYGLRLRRTNADATYPPT